MNLPCFYEPVIDNVYLADFYKDPSRYSFPLQVSLLSLFNYVLMKSCLLLQSDLAITAFSNVFICSIFATKTPIDAHPGVSKRHNFICDAHTTQKSVLGGEAGPDHTCRVERSGVRLRKSVKGKHPQHETTQV